MKITLIVICALMFSINSYATVTSNEVKKQQQQSIQSLQQLSHVDACFTPGDNCEDRIIDEIRQAKRFILVQAYSFTSAPIAKAIVERSKQKNMIIEVILDKSQLTEKYTAATFFKNQRIITYIDYKHAIAHNKVIIIDGNTLITGSYNFTKAALHSNAENLLIIKNSPALINKYISNLLNHRNHSNRQ